MVRTNNLCSSAAQKGNFCTIKLIFRLTTPALSVNSYVLRCILHPIRIRLTPICCFANLSVMTCAGVDNTPNRDTVENMLKRFEINDVTFDYLIARSGIFGRQILRLCRYINLSESQRSGSPSGLESFWLQQRWLRQFLGVRAISRLMVIFYTYYIGGSLTRSDQITFAGLLRMNGEAYRLTLYNALFCGIPCAIGYFLLGGGFHLLKSIHSYAELPSLLAQHTSLAIGTTSLAVDLFRLVDSAWHRRCWAPFGFLPLAINLPTYMKRLYQLSGIGSDKHPERPET